MSNAKHLSQKLLACPHLGMLDDTTTTTTFPSEFNHCLHCKIASIPSNRQQSEFCLTPDFADCEIHKQSAPNRLPPKCAGSMSRRLSCRFSSKRGWQCFSQEFWQFSLSLARLHASLSLFRHLMPGHHTLARNRLCSVPAHPPLTCALHTSLPHRFSIKSRFLLQYPSTRSCN